MNRHYLKYRPDIDGLRAIAVLSVVGFHAFPNLIKGGFIGVDIFFVISGYLISSIIFKSISRDQFNFSNFYARRIRRIFPALLTILVICLIFGWATLLPNEYQELGKQVAAGAGFISNLLFWKESGYFDSNSATKPLLHLWSLGIEEQFYVFWPILIWATWKRRVHFIAMVFVIFLASFLINILAIKNHPVAIFYLPISRFWEFLAGSILAWLSARNTITQSKPPIAWANHFLQTKTAFFQDKKKQELARNFLSFFGLLVLIIGIFLIDEKMQFPGILALIPVIGTTCIIAASQDAYFNRLILSNRLMVWIGLISFPLYLWHWPILVFARILEDDTLSNSLLVICILTATSLAWLTFKFVETPIRTRSQCKIHTQILVLAMTLIGIAGSAVYLNAGFQTRFPRHDLGFFKAKANFDSSQLESKKICSQFKDASFVKFCEEEGRPSIFLLGDSHADSLIPGLSTLQKISTFSLSYATGCGLAPYIGFMQEVQDGWCDSAKIRFEFNNFALSKIEENQPEIILIHARWAYDLYRLDKNSTLNQLDKTILQIKKVSPKSMIAIIGPVPNWNSTSTRAIYSSWRKQVDKTQIPVRLTDGYNKEIQSWDEFMSSHVPTLGVKYLSAYKVFCNANGCIARVGDTSSDVTTIDYGHLSPAGSIFLIDNLKGSIFELLKKSSQLNQAKN